MSTGNIAKNDITGRYIKTLPPTQAYRDGWDNIFKVKKQRMVLASANFCGPGKLIKEFIKDNKLDIEIRTMEEDDTDFFTVNKIKSVPQLLVYLEDTLVETILGSNNIIQTLTLHK